MTSGSGTVIDPIFVSDRDRIKDPAVLNHCLSDHSFIYYIHKLTKNTVTKHKNIIVRSKNYRKENFESVFLTLIGLRFMLVMMCFSFTVNYLLQWINA